MASMQVARAPPSACAVSYRHHLLTQDKAAPATLPRVLQVPGLMGGLEMGIGGVEE